MWWRVRRWRVQLRLTYSCGLLCDMCFPDSWVPWGRLLYIHF